MSYCAHNDSCNMSAKMNHCNILKVLFFVLVIKFSYCDDRKISVKINPNCQSLCEKHNITTVYLRSEGAYDALHFIWDFSGKPSVLLAVTGPSAQLDIDWVPFLWGQENSVKFTETPRYTFGMVVLQIYEFNDVNDTGSISSIDNENINVLHTKKFRWDRKATSQNEKYFELSIEGTNYKSRGVPRSGSVKFLLNRFWTLDHSDIMPHLLHTENSTQVDMIIDNLETNSTFKNSRFAVQLLLIGNHNANSSMTVDFKKTLDDEHTPGIFEMIEVQTPDCEFLDGKESCGRSEGKSYLEWRPVSYTAPNRDLTSSTEAKHSLLAHVTNHVESANNSLLYSFYGSDVKNLLLQKVNISLGSTGDGFYKKSNYSSWTFTVGYGTPPDEQFSFLVIMIISIGLGLPTVIIIVAGIYICARRRYKRKDTLSLNS